MRRPLEDVLTDQWQTTREIAHAADWPIGKARYRLHRLTSSIVPVRFERGWRGGLLVWRRKEAGRG